MVQIQTADNDRGTVKVPHCIKACPAISNYNRNMRNANDCKTVYNIRGAQGASDLVS
jgi:hypothetical protein